MQQLDWHLHTQSFITYLPEQHKVGASAGESLLTYVLQVVLRYTCYCICSSGKVESPHLTNKAVGCGHRKSLLPAAVALWSSSFWMQMATSSVCLHSCWTVFSSWKRVPLQQNKVSLVNLLFLSRPKQTNEGRTLTNHKV